jgi:hypothetical protein
MRTTCESDGALPERTDHGGVVLTVAETNLGKNGVATILDEIGVGIEAIGP